MSSDYSTVNLLFPLQTTDSEDDVSARAAADDRSHRQKLNK